MVADGVKLIVETEKSVGGQLGRPSGARFRTYERLKAFAAEIKGTVFAAGGQYTELTKTIEEIYKYPLLQSATDTLNRQLKSGIDDASLAELVVALRQDGRLCLRERRRGDGRAAGDLLIGAAQRQLTVRRSRMRIDVAAVRKCLKAFDFATLFREHLGWDKHQAQIDIPVAAGKRAARPPWPKSADSRPMLAPPSPTGRRDSRSTIKSPRRLASIS